MFSIRLVGGNSKKGPVVAANTDDYRSSLDKLVEVVTDDILGMLVDCMNHVVVVWVM